MRMNDPKADSTWKKGLDKKEKRGDKHE